MIKYLVEVGPKNVAGICTNYTNLVHIAIKIIQKDWPYLYFMERMIHVLKILL
jgi:hypothetical protein